jgi:hypothetical protein
MMIRSGGPKSCAEGEHQHQVMDVFLVVPLPVFLPDK